MKVALVSRFPKDTNNPRGGVETATLGLARALVQYGHCEVHVITLEKGITTTKVETHEGIVVHRLNRSSLPMFLDVFNGPSSKRLRTYLYELNPDIVHFHETWGFGSRYLNLPSVFTVHGFDSLNLPTERRVGWQLRAKVWRIVEAYAMKQQKALISIAPYVREQIEPLTSATIYNIWNPLSKSLYEVERREQFPTILFLGWLNSRKNPLALVEAVAAIVDSFPGLRVRLCGEASDSHYYATLVERICQLNLTAIVELPGRLSQSDVREELVRASVLVLPSFQENAPMVISEAMAAGVPVIASNLCGVPDMLTDGESGILIDPTDIESIASALRTILSDNDLRAKMSVSARTDSRRRFHPESVAAVTMNCYQKIIGITEVVK